MPVCEWCGGPTPVTLFDGQPFRGSDGELMHDLACSEACKAAALQRSIDEGRLVRVSDLTAERTRDLLSSAGLCSPVLGKALVLS